MTEFINNILSNQYVQIVLSAINFIGWGSISVFIVNIVSWRRKLKTQLNKDILKKSDLSNLAKEYEIVVDEIDKLKSDIERLHEYNRLTNDAVVLQILSSRRIDGATKLSIAKRAQILADNEVVKKAAETVIATIPENTYTEEEADEDKSRREADETDLLLKELGITEG